MSSIVVQLGEADTTASSFVRSGVVDKSAATAIKGVAETGMELHKGVVSSELQSGLQGLEEENLGTFEEPTEVSEVRDKVNRLSSTPGLPADKFRTRAEVELKKAIESGTAFEYACMEEKETIKIK